MRQELLLVYPFVKKWATLNNCDYENIQKDGTVLFADNCIGFELVVGHFNEPRLRAINFEIHISLIWDVPVPNNEEHFKSLMELLNQGN